MALNIDKAEMDQAWINRKSSDKFYKYIYDIAKHQVARKRIIFKEREDYVQFAVYKCFKHQESYSLTRGAAYSFFWKQISLSIAYKQRKEARRNSKIKTFYVDQEKILDWAEKQYEEKGELFSDIIDPEEAVAVKKAFKKYNLAHKGGQVKPSKDNLITVLKWHLESDPTFLQQFTTLRVIFENWIRI